MKRDSNDCDLADSALNDEVYREQIKSLSCNPPIDRDEEFSNEQAKRKAEDCDDNMSPVMVYLAMFIVLPVILLVSIYMWNYFVSLG